MVDLFGGLSATWYAADGVATNELISELEPGDVVAACLAAGPCSIESGLTFAFAGKAALARRGKYRRLDRHILFSGGFWRTTPTY